MKLPSYLVKSRHGVFYFRLTVRNESGVHERRFSLETPSFFMSESPDGKSKARFTRSHPNLTKVPAAQLLVQRMAGRLAAFQPAGRAWSMADLCSELSDRAQSFILISWGHIPWL